MRRVSWILSLLIAFTAVTPAMAVDMTWLGVNNENNTDIEAIDVDDALLWDTSTPGSDDVAVFNFNDYSNDGDSCVNNLVIPAASVFAPGSLKLARGSWQSDNGGERDLILAKSMTFDNVAFSMHANAAGTQLQLGVAAGDEKRAWLSGAAGDLSVATGTIDVEGNLGSVNIDLSGISTLTDLVTAIDAATASTGVDAVEAGSNLELFSVSPGLDQYVKLTRSDLSDLPGVNHYADVAYENGKKIYGLPDASNITVTLTGDGDSVNWQNYGEYNGSWALFRLVNGAKVDITGDNIDIDSGDYGRVRMGGEVGTTVDVSGVGVTVDQFAIRMGYGPLLRVRSDQTWNDGHFDIATYDGCTTVASIDGGRLDNLGNVRLVIGTDGNNGTYNITGGTFESIDNYWSTTSGRTKNYELTDDLVLTGAIADTGADTDVSMHVETNQRATAYWDLQGYDLTTALSVKLVLTGEYGTQDLNYGYSAQSRRIIAEGSTVTIGGDLINLSDHFEAGQLYSGNLQESFVCGLTGDASTVVNLGGDFVTNMRDFNGTGGYEGLANSTLNMLGGDMAEPATLEVRSDAAVNNVALGVGAFGALNIGAVDDPAYVALVNDYLNDNDPDNVAKVKDGEILLVGDLSIVNGTLDCNGLGVTVANTTTLDIDTDSGTLDLATGGITGGVVDSFKGVGDQTAAWATFQDRVIDSDSPSVTFSPFYVASLDTTYWLGQGAAPTGNVSAGNSFVSSSGEVVKGFNGTVTVILLDDAGYAVSGLTDADFSIALSSGTASNGTVSETATPGTYTFTVTDSVGGTVTVDVTADGVLLTQQADVEFLDDFIAYQWLGICTSDATSLAQNDVDDGSLWKKVSDGTTGVVPGPAGKAIFPMNDSTYAQPIFIPAGASFNPGAIRVDCSGGPVNMPLYVQKSMSINYLELDYTAFWSGGGNVLRIGSDDYSPSLSYSHDGTNDLVGQFKFETDVGSKTYFIAVDDPSTTDVDESTIDSDNEIRNMINADSGIHGVTSSTSYRRINFNAVNGGSSAYIKISIISGSAGHNLAWFGEGNYFDTQVDGFDAVPAVLDLTGPQPITFEGDRSGWRNIHLAANSGLEFSNAAITLQSPGVAGDGGLEAEGVSGGSGAYVAFTAVGGTIDCGDTLNREMGNVNVDSPVALQVRGDQVWTGVANSFIHRETDSGEYIVTSSDGAPLQMGGVAIYEGHREQSALTDGAPGYLAEGTYGGIMLRGTIHWTDDRQAWFRMMGDVSIASDAVDAGSNNTVPSTPVTGFGIMLGDSNDNRYGAILDTNGFQLDVTNGVKMLNSGATTGEHLLIADGSTVNIGGDVHIETTNATNTDQMGLTGDATTVFNLSGSYWTDVLALSAADGDGLTSCTVNMLGGSFGSPVTLECTADPDTADFGPGTGAFGTLNIGTVAEDAYVQLADANVNDGDGFVPEVVLVSDLNIVNGRLILNGLGCTVSGNTLTISNGLLDLTTGGTEAGVLYLPFSGLGDQTPDWDTQKSAVIDSDTPGLTFVPLYIPALGRTYWIGQTGSPNGTVQDDSLVTAVPTTTYANGISSSQVTVFLADTNGHPITGATITPSVTGSAVAGAVTEAGGGLYQFAVTDDTAETVDVSVTANGTPLNSAFNVEFIDVNVDKDDSTVSPDSVTIGDNGVDAATLTVYIEDDAGNPVDGIAEALKLFEDSNDTGLTFVGQGGGVYTVDYVSTNQGSFLLTVAYDFLGDTEVILDDAEDQVGATVIGFPVADAGADQNIVLTGGDGCSAATILDASGTFDSDGDITSYIWKYVGSGARIDNTADVLDPTLDFYPGVGVHEIELTVTDSLGHVDTDTVTITVTAADDNSIQLDISGGFNADAIYGPKEDRAKQQYNVDYSPGQDFMELRSYWGRLNGAPHVFNWAGPYGGQGFVLANSQTETYGLYSHGTVWSGIGPYGGIPWSVSNKGLREKGIVVGEYVTYHMASTEGNDTLPGDWIQVANPQGPQRDRPNHLEEGPDGAWGLVDVDDDSDGDTDEFDGEAGLGDDVLVYDAWDSSELIEGMPNAMVCDAGNATDVRADLPLAQQAAYSGLNLVLAAFNTGDRAENTQIIAVYDDGLGSGGESESVLYTFASNTGPIASENNGAPDWQIVCQATARHNHPTGTTGSTYIQGETTLKSIYEFEEPLGLDDTKVLKAIALRRTGGGGGGLVVFAASAVGGGAVLTVDASVPSDEDWTYQNTQVATSNPDVDGNNKVVATITLVEEANPGDNYTVTLDDGDADPTKDQFRLGDVTQVGNELICEIHGGWVQVAGVPESNLGTYTVTLTVEDESSNTASAQVDITLRRLGDIDGDNSVGGTDKQALNNRLNGVTNPSFVLRDYDLDGDGSVGGGDKSILNNVLNGVTPN